LQLLLTTYLAVLGLCVGSFLNVVIARMPHAELDEPEATGFLNRVRAAFRFSGHAYASLWTPKHSKCPHCGHQIRWYENIPVVSWLALRGKCSACKAPISPRYILVELLTGTLFVTLLTRFEWNWQLVSALTFLTFLIPLIFIDAEHWILPFELTLPGILGGVLLAIPRGEDAFMLALVGAVAGFIAFRVMEFIGWVATGTEALGAGDKYLLAMVGAQIGWKALLGVILLSSLQGSIVGIARMKLTGRAGPKTPEKPDATSPLPPAGEGQGEGRPQSDPDPTTTTATDSALTPTLSRETGEGVSDDGDEEENKREPFTPEFIKPGYAWWARVLLVPYTIFLQDIPDAPPPDERGEVPDWEPGANNIPFGPWIGLAGIEVLLFGPRIVESLAHTPFRLMSEIVFGQ
jgi:leader peptidase (prepilin peptidase)/N-methyltransferase